LAMMHSRISRSNCPDPLVGMSRIEARPEGA
jgi:hypothetical protein